MQGCCQHRVLKNETCFLCVLLQSGEGNFVDWKAAGWTDTGGLNWSLLPKICSWMDVTGGRNYTGDFLKYLSSQLQTPAGREHWVTS